MSRSYDGFVGSADTPYVVSVFFPGFVSGEDTAETFYCHTPSEVLSVVREHVENITPEQIVTLLECWAGEGVTLEGWEFSVEREW